ncbi:prepilin-type N-terminal cleavage/methylation domain-containing protein [Neptunomonas marina]|uniref:Prepilin-type N-terminal cleavage/methylation domain-containing protein n=1 Tax=Neptunomonas marina TaxID=1815562 RepID=A0A437Q9E7_9GAMM|nr:prepilin-type N-terminal cleavage/methylation domain-containing protein [Neptunomonas marina]RVU31057.1 prepilin-type N-terminal cleavage/methylation domain-containing protein [Neptunomonas marina]
MKKYQKLQQSAGFSLVELMISVGVIAVLASIAYPSYQDYVESVNEATAISEITVIAGKIDQYFIVHNRLPNSLNQIGVPGDMLLDPWDTPYQYTVLATLKGKGKARKNKNLVPINTDYDLYSSGKDKRSVSPLTAKHSRDDIVRANNGGFIGLASDYER